MRLSSFTFRLTAFLGLSALLFTGCSTELDSNADYKEILVIYSVLDPGPGQTTHYAKVNKAFLNTKSNALTIAANNPDSTQYGDELKVVLQKLTINGKDTTVRNGDEYPMERFVSNGKEPGAFFSPEQVLYRTTGSVVLDQEAIYRVWATNTKTGVSAYGVTPLVKDTPNNPSQGLCIYKISLNSALNNSCYTESQPSAYEPQFKGNSVRFHAAPNAKIYTVKLTFKFFETTNGNRQEKQVEWYLRNNFIHESINTDPEVVLEPQFFTTNLLALIDRSQDNATTEREAGDVFITVTGGSPTLELYYRINNSFSLISQTRPEYDNITNGTGLVASRRAKIARGILTKDAKFDLSSRSELKFIP